MGGGLSAAGRARREKVRLQAAEWFAEGVTPPEVARRLRVSSNSAYVWRRLARAALLEVLPVRTPLPGCVPRWRPGPVWVGGGPAVDPERVSALTGRLFHVRYTLRGPSFLLHRLGFSPQVPVHRAAERDEDAIAAWRAVTWAKVRG